MRRLIWMLLVFGAFGFAPLAGAAHACPMCKAAIEKDSRLPQAYMYSILFMLGMPATVLAGFGFSMYRLSRSQQSRVENLDEIIDSHAN
jgi:hypothetical protein